MFRDRTEAGRRLAGDLAAAPALATEDRSAGAMVVVGLPRGGVPVAAEVARLFAVPLDVIVVRKLGVPQQPELAMGAIGEGGVRVLDAVVLGATGVDTPALEAVEADERKVLDERVRRLRVFRPAVPLDGKIVIVVDDGIATGSTAAAACRVARAKGATRVVLAAPVGPWPVPVVVTEAADVVVVVEQPERLRAVGYWYQDFSAVSDDEVVDLLAEAGRRH